MKIRLTHLLIILLSLSSCRERGSSERTAVRVKSEIIENITPEIITATYPGKVTPQMEINLSFRIAGIIDNVEVKEGDFLREGEIIATLDNRDYKLQLEATQAEYNAISSEAKRIIALYGEQSVSQNDYEKALSALNQITAKLELHRNAEEDTRLRAPFDGYIGRVNFHRGEAISAGMGVAKFISASSPEIVVNIPAVEYLRREELLGATATVSSYPQLTFSISRVAISHLSNLNQLYECRFHVEANEGLYPPLGVSAQVTLSYANSENRLLKVPYSAIVRDKDYCYVWRIYEGKAQKLKVEILTIESDGRVAIKGELHGGDTIITAGVHAIEQGQEVEPLPTPSKSNIGNIL